MKIVLSIALLLGGCVSTDSGIFSTLDVGSVQGQSVKRCGFLPIAEVVIKIFNKQQADFYTNDEISRAICAAIQPAAVKAKQTTVAGVPIEGIRVN